MVWTQASLPVKAGGIGVHSAAQLALSAFLSSLARTAHLVELILPENLKGDSAPEVQQALMEWSKFSDVPPPPSPADQRQRTWDGEILVIQGFAMFYVEKIIYYAMQYHAHICLRLYHPQIFWINQPFLLTPSLEMVNCILRCIQMLFCKVSMCANLI